ncbi:hypothetical protein U8527_07060 [Kordia algicida OT-1]|uniref:Uncharacterized protein n=1 Tax=Kordia algicida OT-1 TaxID=391587 RepID=A9E9U0_9FLAO|nr:hypothetical protein [Kordia algicida]EDP94704.1 hypothetical protein KAOT1_00470 [Kordia algicida OT-1]
MIVVVVSISITATIIHNSIQKDSIELKNHKKTFPILLDDRDTKLENSVIDLKNNKINILEYISIRKSILNEYSNKHKNYVSRKREIMENQSYLGYSSYKNFLLGIGIRFFTLIVSLFYFSSKIKQYYESKNQKIFYLIISSSFVLTSGYWFTWSLIYKVNSIGEYDFEQWHQNVLLIVSPILILASSYFLFKHYQTIEERLKKVISTLFDQILYVIPENGFVKDEKENDYTKLNTKVIIEVGKEINK